MSANNSTDIIVRGPILQEREENYPDPSTLPLPAQEKRLSEDLLLCECKVPLQMARYVEQHTRELIIRFIAMLGPKGIAKKDLLQLMTPCDQSTIFRITKKLEKDRVIKIERRGQRTSYFIVQANKEVNASIGAAILSRVAIPKIFDGYRQVLEKFTPIDYLEQTLFDFSNSIGAFITYVLLQSMNPYNKLLFTKYNTRNKQEKLVREWIHNAISAVFISRSLLELKRMLYRTLRDHQYLSNSFKVDVNFTLTNPIIKNKDIATKINKAYGRLYPQIYTNLENILTNLPKKIKSERSYDRGTIEKWNSCIHEYGPVSNNHPLFSYPVRQCKKCLDYKRESLE